MTAGADVRVGPASVVVRPDVDVMYLEVDDEPAAIARGWSELERRLVSLRGRRFLATIAAGRYRVSVVRRAEDEPAALGLETGTVAGGPYLRIRLRGAPDAIYGRIPSAMGDLEQRAGRDRERASIEHYRRHDEVDLLAPVRGDVAR